MLVTDHEKLKEEIGPLAARYGNGRSAILPMLQRIQEKYSHVSPYAMQMVADMLDIHPVEVYGVVSFYSFLNTEPKGSFIIRLCRSISCDMQNKESVARQLENDLGIQFGETTPNGKFTLEWTNCLGQCDKGPAMLVNEAVHTSVTPDIVHEILRECRSTFGVHAAQKREEDLL